MNAEKNGRREEWVEESRQVPMQDASGRWAKREECEDQRKLEEAPWLGYFRVGDGRIKPRPFGSIDRRADRRNPNRTP